MTGWQIAAACIFVALSLIGTAKLMNDDDEPGLILANILLCVIIGYVYYRAGLFG